MRYDVLYFVFVLKKKFLMYISVIEDWYLKWLKYIKKNLVVIINCV